MSVVAASTASPSSVWASAIDHKGRTYYYNRITRQSSWSLPEQEEILEYEQQEQKAAFEEKMNMYIELEPDLVVYDQTKNKLKIEQLKEENASISQIREEMGILREQLAKQDKKILAKLREDKTIPS